MASTKDVLIRLFVRLYLRMVSGLKLAVANASGSVQIDPSSTLYPGSQVTPTGDGTIEIGANCIVHRQSMVVAAGGKIEIGANTTLNPFTIVYGHGGTEIGDGVRIAAHTIIIPANHVFEDRERYIYEQGIKSSGITIEDDVWIGAGCRILDGVTIGEGAVIGAGSVVTEDIPEYSIVAGVPAEVVDKR